MLPLGDPTTVNDTLRLAFLTAAKALELSPGKQLFKHGGGYILRVRA